MDTFYFEHPIAHSPHSQFKIRSVLWLFLINNCLFPFVDWMNRMRNAAYDEKALKKNEKYG